MPKPSTPILQHPGTTGYLADTQTQFLRNVALGRPFVEFLDELPAFRHAFQFLRRQEIIQQHLRLLATVYLRKEVVEIGEVFTRQRHRNGIVALKEVLGVRF